MPAPDMPAGNLPVSLQDLERLGADTFAKLLLRHGLQRGRKPAIREKHRGIWRTLTWRDLAEEVAALAAALSARGLRRGAHVAFVGDNRPRLYAAMAAAQALGAVAVPLYQDASAEEMVAPLQCAEATHVFAENQEQVDKLLAILPRCPTIQCIVYDKDRGMRHYQQSLLVSYADLLREGREFSAARSDALRAEVDRGSGQDAAFLFFTSGTAGPARGVVLTYESLIDRARALAETEGMKDTDVTMAYLPPGWVGQNLFGYILPLVVGYCVCCPESSETLVADMREIGPTCFLATPRVLQALLSDVAVRMEETGGFNQRLYRRAMAVAQRAGARALAGETLPMIDRISLPVYNLLIYAPLRDVLGMSKVRVAYTSGEAVAPELLMLFRALGINLKQLYGSTETGFFVALQPDGEVKADTVGRPGRGVEVKITPQREILVRSPGLFKEYHRDPESTARTRDVEGWFRTGDAGLLGEDGHLRILDRMNDVGALSDGTPYAPKLVESKLKFFPYIKEAVAFGDRRDMVCALIDINMAAVRIWADKRNITYTRHADLASRDEVYGLIADCIAKVNAELALVPAQTRSQIHRFVILQKELHADEGVLTRTGKLKRHAIAERYRPLVDAMYEGRKVACLEADGASAELKVFIGQLCHIEAAEEGGERFNPRMSNEDRRAAANLMLMCYEHHRITDDVEKYPVSKLRKMKLEHERRFSDPARAIRKRLIDWTTADQPTRVENLSHISDVLGRNQSDEELEDMVSQLNDYVERLRRVPVDVHRFVGAIAQRMNRMQRTFAVRNEMSGTSILISDIRSAFGIGDSTIRDGLAQLDLYGLGDLDEIHTDVGPRPAIRIRTLDNGWPLCLDIVAFCEATDTPIECFTEDLDFFAARFLNPVGPLREGASGCAGPGPSSRRRGSPSPARRVSAIR